MKSTFLFLTLLTATTFSWGQQENDIIQKIEDEGINNSQVMDILSSLVDVYSPRLSGSNGYYQGAQWVQKTMQSWNCDVRLEEYDFPTKGWEVKSFSMALTSPRFEPIVGYPAAWSGSTEGIINDVPLIVDALNIKALKKLKGTLKGRILLHSKAKERLKPQKTVISDAEIKRYNQHKTVENDLTQSVKYVSELLVEDNYDQEQEDLMAFLKAEEVGAVIMPSVWDNHTIEVSEISFHHLKNTVAIP